MATITKLYSLSLNNTKTYLIATVFIVCNLLLPQLAHLVPQGGFIFLPIYRRLKTYWRSNKQDPNNNILYKNPIPQGDKLQTIYNKTCICKQTQNGYYKYFLT